MEIGRILSIATVSFCVLLFLLLTSAAKLKDSEETHKEFLSHLLDPSSSGLLLDDNTVRFYVWFTSKVYMNLEINFDVLRGFYVESIVARQGMDFLISNSGANVVLASMNIEGLAIDEFLCVMIELVLVDCSDKRCDIDTTLHLSSN